MTGTAESQAPTPAFLQGIERWKRQLLDLTARNRSLYFQETKTTTVAFDRDPRALWAALVDAGATVAVREWAGPALAEPATPLAEAAGITAAEDEDRQKRLKALFDRARTAREEQGVQVLFLTFGWVRWHDDRLKRDVASPLIFVPVSLSPDRRSLQMSDDDAPEVNPALAELLRQEHRIALPSTDALESEGLDAVIAAAATAVSAVRPGWTAELGGSVLDLFAFRKVALVQELERSVPRLWGHPIVRALLGDGSLLGEVPALPAFGRLDDDVPAGTVRCVLPADSSQLSAVVSAARGASLVVQGPPGTGKSQTIANLIAEFIAQGKTVLFVAEKAVAREVVVDRLRDDGGLGEAVLHLQRDSGAGKGEAAAKQSVLDDLLQTFNRGPGRYTTDSAIPPRAAALRAQLNEAADRTHAPLGADGWITLHDLLGRALQQPAVEPAAAVPPLADVSRFWLDEVADALEQLAALGPDTIALRGSALDRLVSLPGSVADGRALIENLERLAADVPALLESLRPYILAADAFERMTAAGGRRLAEELLVVGRHDALRRSRWRAFRPRFWATRRAYHDHLRAGRPLLGLEQEVGAQALALAAELETFLRSLEGRVSLGDLKLTPLAQIAAWAREARAMVHRTPELASVRARFASLEQLGIAGYVESLLGTMPLADIPTAAMAGIWRRWALDEHLAAGVPDAVTRGTLIARLKQAEKALEAWSRAAALTAAASARPSPDVPVPQESELGRLLRWAKAKRRPPLRRVLAESPNAVQKLKPCLVMSPLAVAQYLGHAEGSKYRFDVCVIDEASMIPTADVAVAISLAKQLVITGDSKQMPPTSFFERSISEAEAEETAEEIVFESILDEAATLLPSRSLRWHYRSRDEALIAFSNANFYGGELVTFPAPRNDSAHSGVRFEFVEGAVYGRGGSRANPAEAERAVALLARELREHPGREVAITAMSTAQQSEIQGRVEAAAVSDAHIARWLSEGGRVKNLETVQGDECDTMILSLGYGRDAAGRLILNFGPLAQAGGERRLNVAVTRARWTTILVASIRAADIPPDRASSPGALRLRDYLDYAERGPIALAAQVRINAGADTESPFETAVLQALTAAGLRCVPQVGVGSYRIDIGILHPERDGDFVLGVECDGAAYHAAAAARDRDVIRQAVLEGMGWRIHRIWSTAWFRDPAKGLAGVLDAYNAALAGGSPPSAAAAPAPDPPPDVAFERADHAGHRLATATARSRNTGRSADISVSEAINALVIAIENSGPAPEESAVYILRDAFGLGRKSHVLEEIARRAVEEAVRRGLLRREGAMLARAD